MTGLFFDAQEMEECISAQTKSDRFKGDDFIGRDIAQVHIGTE